MECHIESRPRSACRLSSAILTLLGSSVNTGETHVPVKSLSFYSKSQKTSSIPIYHHTNTQSQIYPFTEINLTKRLPPRQPPLPPCRLLQAITPRHLHKPLLRHRAPWPLALWTPRAQSRRHQLLCSALQVLAERSRRDRRRGSRHVPPRRSGQSRGVVPVAVFGWGVGGDQREKNKEIKEMMRPL